MVLNRLNSHREPMSSVDKAWLRMERPTNLMMITTVMMLEDKIDLARLKDMLEARFLSYKRFKQRTIQDNLNAYWEDDPNFDIRNHAHRRALPGEAGKEELEELVSDLMSTPLDFSKPLWQYHLVENYNGGCALIIRIHHCYADGIALMQVLLAMADTDLKETRSPAGDNRGDEEEAGVIDRLLEPAGELVRSTFKFGRGLLGEGFDLVRHPTHAIDYARIGMGVAAEVAKIGLMSDDPPTRFTGKLGARKRAAWVEPLPLDEVKAVGKALGCSINDVLLSCVCGALRAYLVEAGDPVEGLEIRMVVPVNLRPLDQEIKELGNQFGLVVVALPVGIENPLERLYRVRDCMQELKDSYQAHVFFGLLSALGKGPDVMQQTALDLLSKKGTAVMTNVPGPQQALYIAGAKLAEIMFWVPQSGNMGMGVSILSYNNYVHFGLVTDEKLVSDPQTIAEDFGKEFEKLLLITLMEPWGEPRDAQDVEDSLGNGLGQSDE